MKPSAAYTWTVTISRDEFHKRPQSLWVSTLGLASETIKASKVHIASLFSLGTQVAKTLVDYRNAGGRLLRLRKNKFGIDWSRLGNLEQSQILSTGSFALMTNALKLTQNSERVEFSLGKITGAKSSKCAQIGGLSEKCPSVKLQRALKSAKIIAKLCT